MEGAVRREDDVKKKPKKETPPQSAEVEWGRCPGCGFVTAWMGNNVRCDDCGLEVYVPATVDEAREAGAL